MDISANVLAVAIVSLLAAISPGPDFFIVLRNSLIYSRKIGLWTTLGVSVALIAHLTYTVVGIAILIAESPVAYSLIKYAGVAYLFYLGVSGIRSSFQKSTQNAENYSKLERQISPKTAFTQGFLTNLLNPKCALFFLSLFSQFINAETPTLVRVEYAFINWIVSITWFLFLSYLVTGKALHGRLHQFRNLVDRVMGSALILLGAKMLLV